MNDIGVADEQIADIRQHITDAPGLPTAADLRQKAQRPNRRRVVRRQWAIAIAAVIAVVAMLSTIGIVGTWRKQQAANGRAGRLLCDVLMLTTSDYYLVLHPTTCIPPDNEPSRFLLAHTVDGGLSWQTRPMLAYANEWQPYPGDGALVLDASTVLSNQAITHDGGRTWAAPNFADTKIDRVPAGWPVFWADSGDQPNGYSLVTVSPALGIVYVLSHVPSAGQPSGLIRRVKPATDGSLWSGCQTGGHLGVAVSRDRGHSWPCVTLPTSNHTHVSVDSFDGRTAYAVASGDAYNTRTIVYTSTDGGLTWQVRGPANVMPQPTDQILARADRAVIGIETAQSDTGSGPLVESVDGRTFAQILGLPPMIRLEHGWQSGYRVLGADQSEWISDDGATFRKLLLPAGVRVR